MDFRVLGSLEVLDGQRPVALPSGRARALLALLTLHAGEVVGTERIIDELWGESPPATVTTALHGLISTLRKRIEPDREPKILRTVSPGYLLDVDPMDVDANRFRHAVDVATGQDAATRSDALHEALAMWRGPALADFAFEPFAQSEITALDELRLSAVELRVDADLELGREAEVIAELEPLVAAHPFRERLRGQLMLALYRSGRQAEALDAYGAARDILVSELGIEPGSALRELERAVLNQDPELDREDRPTRSWLGRERRSVTVVYADLDVPDADPEAAEHVALGSASHIIRRHSGSVDRNLDDTLVGLFGYPVAHEDDVHRAVRAAIALRDRVGARVGIDTGDVVIGDDARVSGPPVRAASRLARTARDGQIVVGETTRSVLATSAAFEPTTDAWTLIDVHPDATPIPRRLDAPMVGRDEELARLRTTFDRVVADRTPYRFTIVGDAGIGKSRLAADLAASLDVRVVVGRCPAYGEGITLLPLREMGFASSSEDRLAGAVRRFFEALAADGPVVAVFEDIHWAEPTLLDVIAEVTDTVDGPMFIVCLARPDLLDARPAWGVGGRRADTLVLEPLREAEVTELIAERLEGRTLLPGTIRRVIEIAEGNPLYVEQLLAAEGTAEVPASVHALLAARIDRLGPAERDLLRIASVIGSDLTAEAIADLAPEGVRPTVRRHLAALERKRFLRASTDGFAFGHGLIQAAAYRDTPKEVRADLHDRLAERLARTELDEIVGYHLEQAHRNHTDLGRSDERTDSLRRRAGEHLAGAGLHAAGRYDVSAGANLLDRAARLLDPGPRRIEVVRRLAEVCQALGRTVEADAALADVRDEAELAGDHALAQVARLERVRLSLTTGPDPMSLEDVRSEATRTLDLFGDSGDDAVLAAAHYVLWMAYYRAGQTEPIEAEARLSLYHADRSGTPREAVAARIALSWSMVAGPTRISDALEVCQGLLDAGGFVHPVVAADIAALHAMAGDTDASRVHLARARALTVEDDSLARQVILARAAATVARAAGDDDGVRRELRVALDHALDAGLREGTAQASALLAQSWAEAGDLDQADALAALSRQHAPRESVAPQALWRMAKALVSSARGAHDEAVTLARDATGIVPQGMLNLRGEAFAVSACVLRRAGLDATDATGDAIAAYDAKGNLAALRRLSAGVA